MAYGMCHAECNTNAWRCHVPVSSEYRAAGHAAPAASASRRAWHNVHGTARVARSRGERGGAGRKAAGNIGCIGPGTGLGEVYSVWTPGASGER
jgi:hypothetical protein